MSNGGTPPSGPGGQSDFGISPFWQRLRGQAGADTTSEPQPCALLPNDDHMFWAMRNLSVSEAPKHLMICGTTGSGKSTTIQLFLQSIAHRFMKDRTPVEQLILFDAKGDIIPFLAALGLDHKSQNVSILNPIDARCVSWNIGEAAQQPVLARQVATLLVPEEKNATSRYFSDAARELVYAVILGLNEKLKTRWSLRDLLCALESIEHIKRVTKQHERASRLTSRILDDAQHSFGVLSTLGTKLGPYEQVAALWHSNKTAARFSIPEFLAKPGVLVLGNDPVLKESLWPINAILLKALVNEILRRPDSKTLQPRHWFILDEFRAMEKVDCIHDLLNRGRSKGASVLLGIQSVEGLMQVYQEHGANDILSMCTSKTFLRVGGPHTAEWAERHFGKIRNTETVYSESSSTQGGSESRQYKTEDRSVFLASFFLDLPFPGLDSPYVVVSDVPSAKCTFITHREFNTLRGWCKKAPENASGVELRTDVGDQTLSSWMPDEQAMFSDPAGRAPTSGQTISDLPSHSNPAVLPDID